MILLYSGADRGGNSQTLPYKSLGGYCSSSPVGNRMMGNLFSSIGVGDLQNSGVACVCIFIFNETTSAMADVELFYVYQDNAQAKIEISSVTPSIDASGCPFVELIPNSSASPFNVSFVEANGAYEYGTVTITSAASIGDTIQIFNGATLLATTAAAGSALTIEQTTDALITAMTGNTYFTFTKTATNKIKVTNLTVGNNEADINFDTDGTANVTSATLSGGVDNSVNLGTIPAKGHLALWIRRTIDKQVIIDQNTQVIENQIVPGDRAGLFDVIPKVSLPVIEAIDFHFNF